MAANKKKMWFGFLEAGTKGSPVVRDANLDTGNPKTVYLFNFMKEKILEYRRDIVEVKLRELAPEEQPLVPELRKAYTRVRETFEPRAVPLRRPVRKLKPALELDDFPEIDTGDDDDFGGLSPSVFEPGDDDGDSAVLTD